jgi:hypothetical protein
MRKWPAAMKLSQDRSQKLLQQHGIWMTEACDKCGRLLGSVRWTHRGEPGEWCSAQCCDGISSARSAATVKELRRKRIGARPAGRPKKHANNAEKCREYRKRLGNVLATRNTPSQQIENTQIAAAKNGSRVLRVNSTAQPPRNVCFRNFSSQRGRHRGDSG